MLQQLKDPDSAKFGDTSVVTSPDKSPQYKELRYVCGTVNAKNSLGGYAGASRFVVLLGIPADGRAPRALDTRLEGTPGDSLFSLTAWDVDCKVNSHA
ncbi:hypothetical protein [Delftia sp. HK171]|uniref:hypothetical protein n=1 Tax=Delftia sp. HK171 TaxID=1920191 RepID=UPI001154AC9E|nr:hypothetical protein [Delftia sp. HK171]